MPGREPKNCLRKVARLSCKVVLFQNGPAKTTLSVVVAAIEHIQAILVAKYIRVTDHFAFPVTDLTSKPNLLIESVPRIPIR